MPDYEASVAPSLRRGPRNKGKLVGAKPPLRPKHVWSIRTKLQVADRKRDPEKDQRAGAIRGYRTDPASGG